MKEKKVYSDDDGRTIAPMDLEGMPWRQKKAVHDVQAEGGIKSPPLSLRETGRYIFHAMGAGLLIALVFIGAGALFILFCQYVWLK